MKMKKIYGVGIIFLLFILGGCNQQENSAKLAEPKMLHVEVKFVPDMPKVNETFKIQAHVTMGNEKVNDASEVEFEFWKVGQENHEMVEGKNVGDGVYGMDRKVTEKGEYYVIAHVTARNMHNMPKVEFEVK